MKKGRHRRFEEARALKRSQEVDLHGLLDELADTDEGEHKPEHDAWADLADEWDTKDESDGDVAEAGDDGAATAGGVVSAAASEEE